MAVPSLRQVERPSHLCQTEHRPPPLPQQWFVLGRFSLSLALSLSLPDLGCRVSGVGCRVQGVGCRV